MRGIAPRLFRLRVHQLKQLLELIRLAQGGEKTVAESARAARRRGRMSADMNRDAALLRWLWKAFQRVEIEMFAVEGRRGFTPQRADRLDRLVGTRAALMEVESERV